MPPHDSRATLSDTEYAPSGPSLRSTHYRTLSDSNAYPRFGRSLLTGGPSEHRMSDSQTSSGYAPLTPLRHFPTTASPLSTHRPRPVYAFGGSANIGSYPGANLDHRPFGVTRRQELSQTGTYMVGTSGGVQYANQEPSGARVAMKEEAADDDAEAAAHLRSNHNVGHGDVGDEEDVEGEASGRDEDMRVWGDLQDEGAGEFGPHGHHFAASSSSYSHLGPPSRHTAHASFSSDGSFSDDYNPSMSASPTDSTSPTTARPRRHGTSAPGPAPVPGLTKKSRGRRVPTLESSGSGQEKYDGGGRNPRAYTCDACGKIFARGEHLKRHVRSIHTYEKRK